MQTDSLSQSPVLMGWKDIARYLNMGVRTVQRYERERALPVRRPWGNWKGPVLATKSELDVWVTSFFRRQAFESKVLLRSQPERDELGFRISRARRLRLETLGIRDQLLDSIAKLQKTIGISQSRTLRLDETSATSMSVVSRA